jgi:DHA1 family bicyclomycin/chloramphenicol resistance-like MFS transporter
MDAYMPALPTVAADLSASTSGIALTMTAFLVGLGVGMLFSGSVSDRRGRRIPLLIGLGVYVLAALGCASAPSLGVLIALRFVLGMASAGGFAIGQAVIADYTRGTKAARLLSRMALATYLAPILAPPIGAQLLRVMPWRGIFVVLAVLGGVILFAAFRVVGESLPPERRTSGGIATTLRTAGGLLRDPHFASLVAMGACSSAAFYGYLTGVSIVFQEVGGLTPTAFSVVFTINAAGMLASTQINHRLLARFTPRRLLGMDLLVAVTGCLVAVGVSFVEPLNVVALAAALFVTVTAIASLAPNAVALALSLHPETAGSASAVYGACGMVLGALATPLVGVGGGGALAMTLVMGIALLVGLTVYVVGPRRFPDNPDAAALEPLEDVFQA